MKFVDLPIRRKLLRMILVITAVVLLASCAVLVAFDLMSFRRDLIREFGTLCDVIATNSRTTLAFDGKEDATNLLQALTAEQSVTLAAIYNAKGNLFAAYEPQGRAPLQLDADLPMEGHLFRAGSLITTRPIRENGKFLGTLAMYTDLRWYHQRLGWYATIGLSVVALAFLAATVFSRVLRKTITGPIEELSRVAGLVSARGEFSLRAHRFGEDELGALTNTFNHMLGQIQQRDAELRESEARDIMERKASEAEVLRLNADLERRVALRTVELEESNRNLEAFAYSVSHDLRAPLRVISGYSEVLLEDRGEALPQDHKLCLTRILDGTGKMNRLIDDLLQFSRLGQQPMKVETTSFDRLFDEVIVDQEREIGKRTVEWKRHPLPNAQCDPGLMRQVIINLISNALKYSRPRDPTIIEIGANLSDRDYTFFVRDNGVGFDSAASTRLFGVFQRMHSAQEFEGNGVGLATAARIVRRHGGRIWAESRPDQGATFSFSLPVVPETEDLTPKCTDFH